MDSSGPEQQEALAPLKVIPAQQPWEALLLPVSGFPVPDEELGPLQLFVQGLSDAAAREWSLSPELFLQFTRLDLQEAARRLSSHAREWMPELGLGVWPDRPPPTLWTEEDFLNLGIGEMPRSVLHDVFQITAGADARESAQEAMLGLGTIVQIMTADDSETLLKKMTAVLLPPIIEPTFRSFPFYVPLLEAKSVGAATAAQLDSWLCGASVYIRESHEDKGVLILSRKPLGKILEELPVPASIEKPPA